MKMDLNCTIYFVTIYVFKPDNMLRFFTKMEESGYPSTQ